MTYMYFIKFDTVFPRLPNWFSAAVSIYSILTHGTCIESIINVKTNIPNLLLATLCALICLCLCPRCFFFAQLFSHSFFWDFFSQSMTPRSDVIFFLLFLFHWIVQRKSWQKCLIYHEWWRCSICAISPHDHIILTCSKLSAHGWLEWHELMREWFDNVKWLRCQQKFN